MSRFPRKTTEMPQVERNLSYRHQVRRITQGNRGGIKINRVLVDMTWDGRKDEKYQKSIEAIKLGRSPKKVAEEEPDHPFIELTSKFT